MDNPVEESLTVRYHVKKDGKHWLSYVQMITSGVYNFISENTYLYINIYTHIRIEWQETPVGEFTTLPLYSSLWIFKNQLYEVINFKHSLWRLYATLHRNRFARRCLFLRGFNNTNTLL